MPLTTLVSIQIAASQTAALDLVNKRADLLKQITLALDTGTGLAQADVIFSDTRSTAATDSLDMVGGGLLDNLATSGRRHASRASSSSRPPRIPGTSCCAGRRPTVCRSCRRCPTRSPFILAGSW
jgi:hypothetical protein